MRPLRASAHAATWILVFAGALVIGVVIHLGQPAARRLVAASVNAALAPILLGRVVVDRVGALGATTLDDVDAHVDGPDGRPVLRVEGVRAHISIWALVHRLFGSRRQIAIVVPQLSVARVDVALDSDASGVTRIERAFSLRQLSGPTSGGAPLHLRLRQVHIGHALVHFAPSAPIDGDVDDLDGSLGIDDGLVTVDVSKTKLIARGLPGDLRAEGTVAGHLTAPALRVHAHWEGAIAAVREVADVDYAEGRLDAAADAAPTTPDEFRSIWPSCTFSQPATVHAVAHGTLPALDVAVRATLAGGEADVTGRLALEPPRHATLHFQAKHVDLRAIAGAAPSSDLSSSGDVTLTVDAAWRLSAHIAMNGDDGEIGRVRVPPVSVEGDVSIAPGGLPTAHAEVHVREAGAPAVVAVHLEPKGRSVRVSFDADVTVPHLDQVTRAGGLEGGSAHARASGAVDFESATASGHVSAALDAVQAHGVSVGHGLIEAGVSGPLQSPTADVVATAESVTAGKVHLAGLRVAGQVGLDSSRGGGGGVTVRDVEAELAGETPVTARASLVRAGPGGLRVDDGIVEGLGAPLTASVAVSAGQVAIKAKSEGIDVGRLTRVIGLQDLGGTAAVDLDATIAAGTARGRVVVDLAHASFYEVREATAHLEAKVRDRRIWGRASATVEDIGTLTAHATGLQVGPGPLVTAAPWRKTFGALDLAGRIDLAKLAARLPSRLQPFDAIAGALYVDCRVERDDVDDVTPGIDATLRTEGLEVAKGKSGSGGWKLAGLDPTVHLDVDADTGATAVQAELKDAKGALLKVHATSSAVPYGLLFSDGDPVGAFRAMPVEAEIDVPSRRVDDLPPLVRPAGLAGNVEGTVMLHGSAARPSFEASVKLNGSDAGVLSSPVDLSLEARYDGARLDGTLEGVARKAKVLQATATIDAPASQILAGSLDGWRASAHAQLDKLPLRTLGWLRDRQIRGNMSGNADLDGLHDDARLRVNLTFGNLQIGDLACKDATAKLAIDGKTADGSIHVEPGDGALDVRAHAGARWGRALAPAFDAAQAAQASMVAKQLRAAVILPFLGPAITALDGQIDADAQIEVDPDAKAIRPKGTIALHGGTFELATFGNEFNDVTATLRATPDGVVRLEDAVAHGLSGTVQAAATARFEGLALTGARADIRMPAKDPLPLVFDGVQMGAMDGQFTVSGARDSQGWNVNVDIPSAHVELPAGTRSLDVQSLGDMEGVTVGIRKTPHEFVEVSLDAARQDRADGATARKTATKIAVKLGRDVRISRGADLDVHIEGEPRVMLTDETLVSGQIRLTSGGTIEVQGKKFEIQNGTVTFVGTDPSNPQVVLTAGWQAPDGVTWVYADFVGPLKTAQVKLRSSPPKSQNEVLALLLYGSADDATNTMNTDANASSPFAAAAAGAATGELNHALSGVNRALDNVGLAGGISTKVDTSHATPRPEVEVQIARDISLQVALVIGAPPGNNPDTTLVTLDWRFLRKWLLETTIGDAGTSIVNVVWQHRY
jgi:TamB, inner membrane protein subunit of TAM complex